MHLCVGGCNRIDDRLFWRLGIMVDFRAGARLGPQLLLELGELFDAKQADGAIRERIADFTLDLLDLCWWNAIDVPVRKRIFSARILCGYEEDFQCTDLVWI
jgi:NTP pyrophosphatase (non-canonical NTP hydrolase)